MTKTLEDLGWTMEGTCVIMPDIHVSHLLAAEECGRFPRQFKAKFSLRGKTAISFQWLERLVKWGFVWKAGSCSYWMDGLTKGQLSWSSGCKWVRMNRATSLLLQ